MLLSYEDGPWIAISTWYRRRVHGPSKIGNHHLFVDPYGSSASRARARLLRCHGAEGEESRSQRRPLKAGSRGSARPHSRQLRPAAEYALFVRNLSCAINQEILQHLIRHQMRKNVRKKPVPSPRDYFCKLIGLAFSAFL